MLPFTLLLPVLRHSFCFLHYNLIKLHVRVHTHTHTHTHTHIYIYIYIYIYAFMQNNIIMLDFEVPFVAFWAWHNLRVFCIIMLDFEVPFVAFLAWNNLRVFCMKNC